MTPPPLPPPAIVTLAEREHTGTASAHRLRRRGEVHHPRPRDLEFLERTWRVTYGGHTVPEDKIRTRYGRLWKLVAQTRHMADRADFNDNSSLDEPFRRVASYEYGRPVGEPNWLGWPNWALGART